MKHWAAALLAVVAVCTSAAAQRSVHTGYWKSYTPRGASFKCQSVTSRRSMERVLGDAGWDAVKKPYPAIDWRTEEAVVVAPERFPRNKDMVFYGLFFEDDTIVLDYGWVEPPPENGVTILPDGTEVFTQGSRSPSEPSTIVVSFERGIDEGYEFFCSPR